MILAGGLGTRLRCVLPDQPKVLASVRGRPFVAYLLDQLASQHFQRAVLCVGYRGEQVRNALGECHRGMQLLYSSEAQPSGTGGALALGSGMAQSDPVLVMNGDSYCECDLTDLLAWHDAQRAEATVLLNEVADTSRFGRVRVDVANRVVGFTEKGAGGAGTINAGIYILSRRVLSGIPTDRPLSLEREVFPSLIGSGLYGYCPKPARFIDIGTPESYAAAESYFVPEGSA